MTGNYNQALIDFVNASPTPFHATQSLAQALIKQGFQLLDERQPWQLQAQQGYLVKRNESSLIAFYLAGNPADASWRMVGAHTDSPCLKVKPNPSLSQKGYWQLGVEIYGGMLLAPWFDRDLSLAGRVTYLNENQQRLSALIDFKRAIASIPNLAIHLHRSANKGWEINPQKELVPILGQLINQQAPDFHALLSAQMTQQLSITPARILDFELCFYDTQSAASIGLNQEFIASARLDNLLSCFAGLQALLNADKQQNCLLVCTDHEEVGSASACGADGPFLEQVMRRIHQSEQSFVQSMQQSLLISADNAHGVHPNYADKHEQNHGPLLNQGPVIKINANQRYATTSETSGFFRQLCDSHNIPYQCFVTRSDMACGSTIGPITASKIGVPTIDIGVPTFAMHSIREMAGTQDLSYLVQALTAFYNQAQL